MLLKVKANASSLKPQIQRTKTSLFIRNRKQKDAEKIISKIGKISVPGNFLFAVSNKKGGFSPLHLRL